MLVFSTLIPATAQTDEVVFPEFKVDTKNFDTNNRNDLYLKSENYHSMFSHSMKFSGDMDQQYDYVSQTQPTDQGSHAADTTFTSGSGVMQFLNGTNDAQTLEYRRSYFSLLDTGDDDGSKIMITSGQVYAFSINVEDTSPIFLRILASTVGGSGASNTFSWTTNVLTPSGNVASNQIAVIGGIASYVPFVPTETGEFIFTISTSKNIIIDEFNIVEEPDVEEIERSYSEEFEGEETIAKFIQLNPGDTSQAAWDINSIIYQAQYLVDAFTYVTPGSLSLYLFSGGNDPLSTDVGSLDTTFTANEAIYVAVVATPPNPEDPDVRQAQEDGMIDGLDIEFLLSGQSFSITSLPENSNFETTVEQSYEQAGTKYYAFSPSDPVLMGVNSSTSNAGIIFNAQDPELSNVFLDPDTHNVKYDLTDDAAVFMPGDYIVGLPTDNKFQFQVFTPENFDVGQDKTLTQTYQDVKFYHLSPNGFTQDYLNITYPDQKNQTVTYDFSIFDSFGQQVQDTTLGFSHYYDNGTTNFVVNNNTSFTSTTIQRNLNGLFLKIETTANSQYNTTGWQTYTNNKTLSASLELKRLNNLQITSDTTASANYYFNSLSTDSSVSHDLNGSINTIRDYLTIDGGMNSAYRITIDTTNRTLNSWDLFSANTIEWTSSASFENAVFTSYTANESGIIHNYYEIEFASAIPMTFGLQVGYDTTLVNGTTSISMENINVQSFPALNIGNLRDSTIGSGDGFLNLGNPFVIGGIAAAGVAVIAGAAILLRRRGGTV